MATPGTKKRFRRIGLFGIIFILAVVYFLFTLIVVMLISSSLHIINNDFFGFKNMDLITVSTAVVIFVISAVGFFKIFVKVYRYFNNAIAKDMSR